MYICYLPNCGFDMLVEFRKKPIKEKTNYVRVISVLTSFKNYINTSLFNLVKLLIKYTYISYRTIE